MRALDRFCRPSSGKESWMTRWSSSRLTTDTSMGSITSHMNAGLPKSLETTLQDIQLAMQRTDIAKAVEFEDSPMSAESIHQAVELQCQMIRAGQKLPTVFLKAWTIESVDDQQARVRVVLD